MTEVYTLYGSYASYYTAKVRGYLRKKGIPFVERLPSDPLFRNKVRPTSGSHRIPQLLTPEGHVVQDSVEIVDYLESRFPQLPAFPSTPRQRTFVHLMELLGSEGLLQLAWLHRWVFAENHAFVKMDFGRSFKPQGDDDELLKYGDLIADRMMSYGLPEFTEALRQSLDQQYRSLLALFEQHLQDHPYFLGGHPSAADYAVLGALHAHMGRDPAGLRTMQDHGPRTLRWVEHMLVPEVQSPEFFSRPIEYQANDQVPETALNILRHIAQEYGEPFLLGALAFNQAMDRLAGPSGHPLDPDQDQPVLPNEQITYNNTTVDHRTNLHSVWLTQRAQHYFQSQPPSTRINIEAQLQSPLLTTLLNTPLNHPINRTKNRLFLS